MDTNLGFQGTLTTALDQRRDYIDTQLLPRMKEQFHIYHAAFQGINTVLLRKGLIHEDPYKYDQKISEVTVPPEGPFLESEKVDQISLRLSTLEGQLDFLVNYYQFSADFLGLARIKRIAGLARYIRWESLTVNSPNLNTRVLAELMEKVKKGSDSLSGGILADTQQQISKAVKEILDILKELSFYQRERYKQEIREKIVQQLNLDEQAVTERKEDAVKEVRRRFAMEMGDRPFYPELVEEILAEDFGSDREQHRTVILRKLEMREEPRKAKKKENLVREALLEAIRLMSGAGYQLDEALKKLADNNLLLQSRKMSFGEKIRKMLRKLVQGEEKTQIFELEYFDVVTSSTRTEKVDFGAFLEEGAQKARLLIALTVRTSTTYRKLEGAGEDRIFQLLSRNLEELQLLNRRLNALDTFFKSEIPPEERNRLRGIKLELNGIKNSVIKANQKRHEYVAQKEEEEQMRKLGISPDVTA